MSSACGTVALAASKHKPHDRRQSGVTSATRTASALILIPAVIACAWFGGIWFKGFVLLLAGLIAHEWASMVHPKNLAQYALHMGAALAAQFCRIWWVLELPFWSFWDWRLCQALMVRVGKYPVPANGVILEFFTWDFRPLPSFFCVAIPDYGFAAILWIFLIVWSADTLAYFAGRIIGGPKLAPSISPKKTWAGLGGAVAGSALVSIIFACVTQLNGIWALAILAGLPGFGGTGWGSFRVISQAISWG